MIKETRLRRTPVGIVTRYSAQAPYDGAQARAPTAVPIASNVASNAAGVSST